VFRLGSFGTSRSQNWKRRATLSPGLKGPRILGQAKRLLKRAGLVFSASFFREREEAWIASSANARALSGVFYGNEPETGSRLISLAISTCRRSLFVDAIFTQACARQTSLCLG
jgi:hypothetical protein